MPSTVRTIEEKGLIRPPHWLSDNIHYETMMGSVAYGMSSDTNDMDIYGFCIPPKEMVFPHLAGEIEGFDRQKKRFEQWQEHHVVDPDDLAGKGRSHDFSIFSIVKYFSLAMENNPNMIDIDPRRIREEEERQMNFLGHQTYLKAKAVGKNSMSEKAGFGKVIKPSAHRGPDCMVKPTLVEPECPARQIIGPDTMTILLVSHTIGSQGCRIPKRRFCKSELSNPETTFL